jgi:hypothetical protein
MGERYVRFQGNKINEPSREIRMQARTPVVDVASGCHRGAGYGPDREGLGRVYEQGDQGHGSVAYSVRYPCGGHQGAALEAEHRLG